MTQTHTPAHTPGPWSVHHSESGRIYIEGPEGDIAVLIHYEHAEADARLIEQAPALLAELETVCEIADALNGRTADAGTALRHRKITEARTAIAAARGEASLNG